MLVLRRDVLQGEVLSVESPCSRAYLTCLPSAILETDKELGGVLPVLKQLGTEAIARG